MARQFYANKERISLSPEKGSLKLRAQTAQVIAHFVLNPKWSQKPSPGAGYCGILNENMQFQPSSTIEHGVQADVEMSIDSEGKLVSYDGLRVHTPQLRVNNRGAALVAFASMPTTPARLLTAANTDTLVQDGALVEALGETFTCGLDANEVDTVRKVRLGKRTVWHLTNWTYYTGHNFVGEDHLLVPVP
jgi:hypothetical protein